MCKKSELDQELCNMVKECKKDEQRYLQYRSKDRIEEIFLR